LRSSRKCHGKVSIRKSKENIATCENAIKKYFGHKTRRSINNGVNKKKTNIISIEFVFVSINSIL
jgi:hypothetical protein